MEWVDAGVVAVVATLVQALKLIPWVSENKKYLPYAAVGLGVLAAYLQEGTMTPILLATGVISGLAAVGLFETTSRAVRIVRCAAAGRPKPGKKKRKR